jgi:DNA-directed RNA polymerase specialized sigma24 family protein
MAHDGSQTDALLQRAGQGDDQARQRLLELHRLRLKRMVAVRMDGRLAARLDPSDVVQEALADAARDLPDYLRSRPMAFYPWLRQLAWERLVRLHRQHIGSRRRSVDRENEAFLPLPDRSAVDLARRLVSSSTSPSGQGEAATGATTLTVRLNIVAFLPMLGMGQAVSILVGQRLRDERPDLAERSVFTGLKWVFGCMCGVASIYLLLPEVVVGLFEWGRDPEAYARVAARVPQLLVCEAVYSLADSVNVTFSFAMRGAGDTGFVSLLTFALAWPMVVIPTLELVRAGGQRLLAWSFAKAYIVGMVV